MAKPKVFLSHSSVDQRALIRLRTLLEQKTAGAIEFFMSSDGQSIPLGRNWVHRIEQALDEAQLLLVFLTPNSMKSPWVFFESGYVYSKNIKVIPVGVLGYDLGNLRPPLSLLQGFNISGPDSLNNLVALFNREFDLSFKEDFTDDDYVRIFGPATDDVPFHTQILSHVEDVAFTVAGKTDELFAAARAAFTSLKLETTDREYRIDLPGAELYVQRLSANASGGTVHAKMDATLLPILQSVIDAMLRQLSDNDRPARFSLTLRDYVSMPAERHKLTAPLFGRGARIIDSEYIAVGGEEFKVGRNWTRTQLGETVYGNWWISFRLRRPLSDATVFDVLSVLSDSGVLRIGDGARGLV